MSNHFSSEYRDRIWGGSAMCPECPRDDWWGSKSCCLQPRERCPDPSGVTTFPALIGPVLVWSQQKLSEIAIYHQVLRVSKGCLPHDPPLEEKQISNRGGSSQLS